MDKKVKKNLSAALAATLATGIGASAIPVKAETKTASVDELYKAAYDATMKAVETAKANGVKAYFDEKDGGASSTEVVLKAVRASMQKDILAAREAINALPAELLEAKQTFSSILDNYQHPVYERIVASINDMKDKEYKQADINVPRELINDVPAAFKASYSSAIDEYQVKYIEKVKAAVAKAEESKTEEDLAAAKELLEDLKTVTFNEGVLEIANKEISENYTKVEENVAAIKEATEAVVKAEESKLEEDVKAAKALVEKLQDEKAKEELTARLDKVVVKVTVEAVKNLNETSVQVSGIPSTVKEADLATAKLTLTAGDTVLTATYVASSLTEDGKANFVLESGKKLADATTYTVASDWAIFTTDTFMARVTTAYVNSVSATTTKLPAVKYVAKDDTATPKVDESGITKVYFSAKNQYGEDMTIPANNNLGVKATLNGVPMLDSEVIYNKASGNNYVEIKKTLAEGNKVDLTFTNKINDKDVEVGTVSYTIAKAEAAVPTNISDMTAKYANAENGHIKDAAVKEVLPKDQITLTVTVSDQFGNPMNGEKVRWVVEEGKDLIDGVLEVSDAADVTFTAKAAGKVKISAYNVSNGAKVTYEVVVGAKKLDTLNLANEEGLAKELYNQDANIVKVVTPNAGANLTADMIKFDVKATKTSVDVTPADVQVTAKVRGGDKDNKNDIVIVVKSTKPGKYTITPYVGESLEKATAKVAGTTGFDVTTTIDETVTSIDDITFDAKELKTGKVIKKDVTFRNKHGEVVVVAAPAATVVTPSGNVTAVVSKDTTDAKNPKNILTLSNATKGTCQVTIIENGVIKPLTLTFTEPALTSIDAGADITGVVAGDLDSKAKYQAVKFLDQDGKAMNFAETKVSVTKPDGQELTNVSDLITLGKTYSVDDKGVVTFVPAVKGDNVVAYKVLPQESLVQGVYTVKIANADGKIADTFTVTVGAARVNKTVEVTPASTNVALNGQVKVKVTPKDQYGEFIAVGTDKIAVDAGANFTTSAVREINKDGGAVDVTHPVAAYEVTLTGNTKGTNDVVVNVKGTDKDGKEIVLSTNKVSMTVDSVANLVNSVAIDTTGIKALYSTNAEKLDDPVQLKAIAKDANGNVVPVAATDLNWSVAKVTAAEDSTKDATVKVDANGKVTADKGFKGSAVIKVVTANMKETTITLNFDNAKAAPVTGTTKVVNPAENMVVDADEAKPGIQVLLDGDGTKDAEKDGAVTFKLTAKDQYGNDYVIDLTDSNVVVLADDTSVLAAKADTTAETITLTAKAAGTSNVYIQYNGDTIKLEVSVSEKAVTP